MAIKQAKVSVADLQRGMFVSGLDRPWTETPFLLQGFYIRDQEEIRQLQKYCRYVYVDLVKTVGDAGVKLRHIIADSSGRNTDSPARRGRAGRVTAAVPCRPVRVVRNAYPPPVPARCEADRARDLHRGIQTNMQQVMRQIRGNRSLPLEQVNRTVEELVDIVVRSPDAFAWLARVRDKDEYTYSHSIRASIWAVIFGRHIGLRRRQLVQLGLASLLKDVGKLMISDKVLRMVRRDSRSELEYRKFVEYSVKLLSADKRLDPQVLQIIRCHRERHDGSGYPRGLRGDKIPVPARMCGIVTFYDEVTNPRGAAPVAPSKAIGQLYELRGTGFQEQLVVEFIQAIGLYPTGTQVELSTGEVGVVVEQSYERRLKPKVMLVLDRDKRPMKSARLFDMAADDERKQKLIERGELSDRDKVSIVRDLMPDTYPQVDVNAVFEAYLFSRAETAGTLLPSDQALSAL